MKDYIAVSSEKGAREGEESYLYCRIPFVFPQKRKYIHRVPVRIRDKVMKFWVASR